MMMEDQMEDHTDTNSLYILICSLLGTVISYQWFGTSPKPATLRLAWLRKIMYRSEKAPLSISFSASACRGC
jgi:hypothetical protein